MAGKRAQKISLLRLLDRSRRAAFFVAMRNLRRHHGA
jgi:hypothetical protein